MTSAQRVQPWLIAAALFVAGFGGRLALDSSPGDPVVRFMYAATIQGLAYGAGLAVLAGWWLRSAGVGGRGVAGCLSWLALAALSVVAILSSNYK